MTLAEGGPGTWGYQVCAAASLAFCCVQGLLAARSGPGVRNPIAGSASQDWSTPLVADTAKSSNAWL